MSWPCAKHRPHFPYFCLDFPPPLSVPSCQPTRWSLVKRAASGGDDGRSALGEILLHYWYPLYAWARRSGMSGEDAADGVQSFMEKACATNLLAAAREERGRLRAWLLLCFQRHLKDLRRHDRAAKRGGGAVHLSVDWQGAESIYLAEPAQTETPDALYARAWAVSLMEEGMMRLATHYETSGRGALHAALLPALEGPLPDSTFPETAASLGMTSGSLRSAAVRMRHRYRAILLELASERLGITNEAALAEELRVLLRGE